MRLLMAFFLIILTSCTSLQAQKPSTSSSYLYNNVTIEIQQTALINVVNYDLNKLKDRLYEYHICRKNRINVIIKEPVPAPNSWSRVTVHHFKNKYRTLYDRNKNDRHLIVYISLLPGVYLERGGNIVGLALQDQHIALFNNFDYHVLLHEFGHIIGLVNRDHREEDPVNTARPKHCNRQTCVMFWRASRYGRFDDRCIKDIKRLIAKRG